MRRGGVLLALWVVVAFAAIGVGTWALSLVGGEINDQAAAPLSSADIDQRLNADRVGQVGTEPSRAPSETQPTATAHSGDPATTTGATRGLSTAGGTVVATCRGSSADVVYLVSWSPAPGYHADHGVLRGPAPTATVVFESDVADDLVVTVRCVNGMPTKSVSAEADDHGDRGSDAGGAGGTGGGATGATTGATSGGTSGGSSTSGGGTPTPSPTDDHGGHGADDPPGDDHGGRRG